MRQILEHLGYYEKPTMPWATLNPQEHPGLLARLVASFGRRPHEAAPSGTESAIVAPSRGDFESLLKGHSPAAPGMPVNEREKLTGVAPKNGGYFENFENYRKGAGRTKAPGVSAARAEAKIAAHFAVTHLDSEHAAASFRAMLRESPKMALWAAHKHPIAFGEPTGAVKPGLRWKDVRELLPHGRSNEASGASSLRLDPVLAGERHRIREQTQRARADQARKRAPAAIRRSLERLARRMERETPTDPDATERASHIREVVRGLTARDAPIRNQAHDQGRRIEAGKKDPATLYKELEEQLRRRDQTRGKQKSRDRADDGRDQ